MKETYKIGDKFLCVNDCYMQGTAEIRYKKGNIYTSEEKSCITDETRNKNHYWNVLKTTEGLVIFQKYQEESTDYQIY